MRRHPASQWLARLLIFLLLVPYIACGPAARAQRVAPAVYVLDFNNETTVGGALLGKIAAAQVSLALSESPNWDVIPDSQVQAKIRELNVEPPFDRIDRARLANGVDATAAVFGAIREARLIRETNGAAAVRALVRIQVVVEDVNTGVLINGAIAEGASTPRMGFGADADILFEEALGKAAFRARESMDRFRLPEGTILNTSVVGDQNETQVLLNIGARQGVRPGMTFVVTRLKEPVGMVRVTSVDADVSVARAIENFQGIKPEDRVKAIFNFEDFPISRGRLRAATPAGPLPVARLAGEKDGEKTPQPVRVARAERNAEFVPFKARQDAQVAQVQPAPPPPVVLVDEPETLPDDGGRGGRRLLSSRALRMLAGGLLLAGIFALAGRGGRNSLRPNDVEAFPFQFEFGAPGAFIKVCWDRPKPINSEQVVQYIVWRFSQLGAAEIVGALDGDAIKCFVDSEATRHVNAFDGAPGEDDAGSRSLIENVPGITPGEQYRYQIATAYRAGLEDRDGDGIPDGQQGGGGGGGGGGTAGLIYMSPLSESTAWVTAIAPPAIIEPTTGESVDLTNLEVTFQQTPGADTYVIAVSGNPNFTKRKLFGPFKTVPIPFGDPTVTQTISVGGLSNQNVVYISVGARNSGDRVNPKPFAAIFSPAVAVRPAAGPPPPPGGSAAGENQRGGKGRGKGRDGNGKKAGKAR